MRRLLLLALASLPACTFPTEPMRVEFQVERQGMFGGVEPTLTVEVPGRIDAAGSMRTPCLPYDATGSLSHESRTITLTIIGEASGDCPRTAEGTLVYRAAIRRLPPGTYTVRLMHTYRDAAWPSAEVLRQRLRVQ